MPHQEQRVATAIYSFQNGAVVVTDQFGRRMLEFEGDPIKVTCDVVAVGGQVPRIVVDV